MSADTPDKRVSEKYGGSGGQRWQVSRAAVFPMAFALLSAALSCQSTQTGRELQDCHTIISTMLQFLFNFYKCSSKSVLLLYLLLKKKIKHGCAVLYIALKNLSRPP